MGKGESCWQKNVVIVNKRFHSSLPSIVVAVMLIGCSERSVESGSRQKSTPSSGELLNPERDLILVQDETAQRTNASAEAKSADQSAILVQELTGKNLADGKTARTDANQPIKTTFSDGSTIRYSDGKPTQFVDAQGKVSSYSFGLDGLLNQKMDAEGYVEKFNYDADGKLVSKIDKDGNVIPIREK